jgi:uncharacterized protein YndB with AHSA1/START domain
MPITKPLVEPSSSFITTFVFDVAAPKERVWRALCDEVDAWWPRAMRSGPEGSRMRFEPSVGGRLREEWGNGAGVLWYTVVLLEPLKALELAGFMTASFGGPAISCVRVALEESSKGTKVTFVDGVQGRVAGDMQKKAHEGWQLVFHDGLKRHCEKKG